VPEPQQRACLNRDSAQIRTAAIPTARPSAVLRARAGLMVSVPMIGMRKTLAAARWPLAHRSVKQNGRQLVRRLGDARASEP